MNTAVPNVGRSARWGCLLRLLTVLLGLLIPASGWALPDESWLVVIGNNRGDADEVQLLYGERDAREFAEVLRPIDCGS